MTEVRPIPDKWWESSPEAAAGGPSGGDWWASSPEAGAQKPALLGGAGATMQAAQPEGLTGVWNEAARKLKEWFVGHSDRAEAKAAGIGLQPTPAEMGQAALAAGSVMAGGATLGGLAANPMRAAIGLAGSLGGEKVGREAGELAERVGAPKGTATVGSVAGGLVGGLGAGGRVTTALRQKLGMEAAEAAPLLSEGPRTLHVPEWMPRLPTGRTVTKAAQAGKVVKMPTAKPAAPAATPEGSLEEALKASIAQASKRAAPKAAEKVATGAAKPPALPSPDELVAKILTLRQKQGQSGAQITSSLRQLYGIPPSAGEEMVRSVFQEYGILAKVGR